MSNETRHPLPLRPVEYQILVGLAAGPRHGYAILQAVEARGDLAAVPGLATLYRAIRRMEKSGLVEPQPEDSIDVEGDDDRRRVMRLTPSGRATLAAETRRLAELVRQAESGLRGAGDGRT